MRTDDEELVSTFIDEIYKIGMITKRNLVNENNQKETVIVPGIDLIMTKINSYGIINDTKIVVNSPEYRLYYHRSWPEWSLTDRSKRKFGNEEFQITGDLTAVRNHLIHIKLST